MSTTIVRVIVSEANPNMPKKTFTLYVDDITVANVAHDIETALTKTYPQNQPPPALAKP